MLKEMNRTSWSQRLTIVMLAVLAFVFSALFVLDLKGYFNRAEHPVAFLTTEDGTVRRLAKSELTWDRASEGTLFAAGDTISTGEESKAKLVFYAGGELELDSGAMVVLVGNLDELKLNFLSGQGRVHVAKNATSKITVARETSKGMSKPDTRVEVAVVDHVDTHTAAPERVLKPPPAEAKSLAPAIQEKNIRSPEKALANQGGMLTVEKLPPTPQIKFPANDTLVDLTEGPPPKLEWEIPPQTKPVSYEIILRSPDGKGEEKVLKSDKPGLPLTEVPPGKYLWSVRAVASNGTRSPASTARGINLRAPAQILRPTVLPVEVE